MKRILIIMVMCVLLAVLMFAIATTALAAGENDAASAAEGGSFYTWGMLATYAGCLAATTVVTQFVKPIWPEKIATQFLCYIVALIILMLANLFMKTLTLETAGISVLNAIVIALAANGTYNNIVKMKSAN